MTEVKQYSNGFKYLKVSNAISFAKIALNGAHIFEYTSQENTPLLWLSDISEFKQGSAIRGGIPICWPAFGTNNPSLSQHGFARTSLFHLVSAIDLDLQTTEVILRLSYSDNTQALWDYKFELNLKITIGENLSLELQTINKDTKEFTITQAFHTYFNISDISKINIQGLNQKPYLDALSSTTKIQEGDIIFNKEVDCVYQEVNNDIVLKDTDRLVKVHNEGSSSLVIWNPWIEKCSRMSAMSKDAYRSFVCIESANAYEDFKTIQPGMSHTLKTTFTSL